MGKGLFISLNIDNERARKLHDQLARKAARLGYFTTRGPKAGRGHVGQLLQDLAEGELAIIKLSKEERKLAVKELSRLSFRDSSGILRKLAEELRKN